MEDEPGKDDYRQRIGKVAEAAGVPLPTAEELAGRLLRLLRQGRGWSQQEVAARMKRFGYNWQQSTVGKIEAAQRPLRVNELADLAIIFDIPVTQLLEPQLLLGDEDDLRALEAEIARLEEEQKRLERELEVAQDARRVADFREHEVGSELARVSTGLEILKRWHPAASGGGGSG